MSAIDSSGRVAEVLRLGLVEGVAVRAIAKRLHMAHANARILEVNSNPSTVTGCRDDDLATRRGSMDGIQQDVHGCLRKL